MPGVIGHQFLFDEPFDFRTDWLEAVSLYTPNQFTIGRRKSCCILVGYVEKFRKLKSCIRYFLGESYTIPEGTTSRVLARKDAAKHPYFPTFRAQEILDLKGIQFDGKEEALSLDALDFAKYQKFKIEISFGQPDYVFESDFNAHNTPGGEFNRYTVITSRPYVETIQVELGQMRFREGPFENRPMQAKPIVRQEKSAIKVKVMQVPLDLVADNTGICPRFLASEGKVNSTTFLNRPRGTMMLDTVELDPYTDPMESDFIGTTQRKADIEFTFIHFDPPAGDGMDTTNKRGWNRQWGYDQKTYWATNEDTDEPLFRYVDMNELLDYHAAL